MLVSSRSFVLVFSFTLTFCASENLDDQYIAKDDVEKARRQMSSYGGTYGNLWMIMPDGNGTARIALMEKVQNNEISRLDGNGGRFADLTPVEESVQFTLFTKDNPKKGESINPKNTRSLNFDHSKPTKIIIHGWQSNGISLIVTSIRDAYLKNSDVNVIAVNWSEAASNIFYPASADYTKKVGKYVANMIDNLASKNGAKYEDFHIIGHSLGAHTAGVAGHWTKKKVSRITGLDPALPCFENNELQNRLDKSDAHFVEVIHTCAGTLGMSTPIGHADFYPNGGSPFQPGCCCLVELMQACSHGRSYLYFAESITSKKAFPAVKCSTWNNFKNRSCNNAITPMGEFTPASARGTYYLQTNAESPFSLGKFGTTFHAM